MEHVDSEPDKHVFAQNARVLETAERVTQPYCLAQEAQAEADALAAKLGGMVDRGIARFATGEVALDDESYAAWIEELNTAGSAKLTALFEGK